MIGISLKKERHLTVDQQTSHTSGSFPAAPERENHHLDVYLTRGKLADVCLDGQSVYPTWFKLEWKETGQMSAKVRGVRISTRLGDAITIHARP